MRRQQRRKIPECEEKQDKTKRKMSGIYAKLQDDEKLIKQKYARKKSERHLNENCRQAKRRL